MLLKAELEEPLKGLQASPPRFWESSVRSASCRGERGQRGLWTGQACPPHGAPRHPGDSHPPHSASLGAPEPHPESPRGPFMATGGRVGHRARRPHPGAPAVQPAKLIEGLDLLRVQDRLGWGLRRKRRCRLVGLGTPWGLEKSTA